MQGFQSHLESSLAAGTDRHFGLLSPHRKASAMSNNGPRSADSFIAPLRIYVGRLVTWAKGRVTGYGLAAALLGVGILFVVIAAAIGTAALFYWIELHY